MPLKYVNRSNRGRKNKSSGKKGIYNQLDFGEKVS
jgi:hypothetical protein